MQYVFERNILCCGLSFLCNSYFLKVLDQGADEKNRASLQKENGGVLEYLPIPSLCLVLQWTKNGTILWLSAIFVSC